MLTHESQVRPLAAPRRWPGPHVYDRAPEREYFPESEEVPETNGYLEICTALYLLLKRELAHEANDQLRAEVEALRAELAKARGTPSAG